MRTRASLSISVVFVLLACSRTKGSGAVAPTQAVTPSISPGTSTSSTPVNATVSCPTPGTLPYVTTDGTTPSTSSTQTSTARFSASGTLSAICAGPDAQVRNNLGVAWTTTAGWRTFQNGTTTGWVASNNLLVTQGAVTSVTGGDLTLPAGSPAVDAGAALPQVTQDFARGARPLGAGYDVGAFESR